MFVHQFLSQCNWTQGTSAVDKEGEKVDPSDLNACKWCFLGAIIRCYPDSWHDVAERVSRYLGQPLGTFNDAIGRTVFDIVRVAKAMGI